MVGYLILSLLQIFCWVWWWKNFEDRLGFGNVMAKNKVAPFFRTRCSKRFLLGLSLPYPHVAFGGLWWDRAVRDAVCRLDACFFCASGCHRCRLCFRPRTLGVLSPWFPSCADCRWLLLQKLTRVQMCPAYFCRLRT